MRLDRNINADGRGKYALVLMRKLVGDIPPDTAAALDLLQERGLLDFGEAYTEREFFVIRLKDRYAAEALEAYANEAGKADSEYADEIREMADRAGPASRFCKVPD